MNETSVPVFRTVPELRRQVRAWRAAGDTLALVPTMGALHRGHLALVEEGQKHASRTIASIFVNPKQFSPTEDFAAYPRDFAQDLKALASCRVDGCFAPDVEQMYPPGFSATVTVAGPATMDLEDHFRPTHFSGVATVVAKLLNQAQPDVAVFGAKDYQQLLVIRAMAHDLDLPVEVVGLDTIREPDGLALSSRNVYLSGDERRTAPALHGALQACAAQIASGEPVSHALLNATEAIVGAGFKIDYLEARHAQTLARIARRADGPIRLLAAVKLGRTRLIDNIAVP